MKRVFVVLAVLLAAAGFVCAEGAQEQPNLSGDVKPVVSLDNINQWDKEVDVCIVGYGLAGASAAIQVLDDNPDADVLILEKMPEALAGGNSRASGQTLLTPDKKDIDKFKTYINACNEPNGISDEYLDWWVNSFCDQLPWIEKTVEEVGYEIGYVGGGPLRWKKVTEFAELPGSDFNATSAHVRKAGGPGFEVGGVWNGFKLATELREPEIMYMTPAVALIQDPRNGEVHGVVAEAQNGDLITIHTKKGVVLSCGGDENNLQMQKDFHGMEEIYPGGTPGNTGDGIQMLMAAGAQIWHMQGRCNSAGYWPGFKVPEYESAFMRQFRMKSGDWIDIGKNTERFFDEAALYHRQHMKYKDAGNYMDIKHWRTLPVDMVFDEDCRVAQPVATVWLSWPISVEGYRWSKDNSAEIEQGWIVKADTIKEFAEKTGRDPVKFQETIDEWNAMCDAGEDTLWGRDPAKMSRIDTAPFYSISLYPVLGCETGGAKRDTTSKVLDWNDKPIPRLYEAGQLGSFISNLYQNGCFLAECVVSGRAAAQDVVLQEDLF